MNDLTLKTEAAVASTCGPDAQTAGRRVEIAGSGIAFEAAEDESILAAALRANVNLAHDCKSGTCGACRMRLERGAVRYDELPMGLMPEEEAEGYALACQAHAVTDLVAQAEILPSPVAEPRRHRATVRRLEPLAPDVTHLVLDLPETAEDFRAGQYADIVLPDGTTRSFSMASAPGGGRLDFHIRRIPGGQFTDGALHDLQPGQPLELILPRGVFYLHEGDFRPILMLATGTGIAPIRAILEALGDDPDCPPVTLYWGGRTEADLYLADEIRRLGARLDDFRFVPVLSRADEGWNGRRGYVQDAAIEDAEDLSDVAAYLCGSPQMIEGAKRELVRHGCSRNHIYADSFLFRHNVAGNAPAVRARG